MSDWQGIESAPKDGTRCDYCAGRGFELDWVDPGGVMRAVPGDTCRHCDGSGEALPPPPGAKDESAT